MRPIFGNMTLGVTGVTVFGPLAPDHENPGIPTATGSTFIRDESVPDGGLGGGGSNSLSSSRRQKLPDLTPGQQFRFGLRILGAGLDQIGRAGARSYDNMIGRNDPKIKLCFQPVDRSVSPNGNSPSPRTPPPGGPSPSKTRRTKTKPVTDVKTNWLQVIEDLERKLDEVRRELDTKSAEAEEYRLRAEEYAPAVLQVRRLEEVQRSLFAGLKKALKENEELSTANETLRQICTEADSALERAKEALAAANTRADENAALAQQAIALKTELEELQSQFEAVEREASELRGAIELSRQSAKLAGMHQTLRSRAENQATAYLQELESVGTGIAQLSEAVLSLQQKFQDADRQVLSGQRDKEAQLTQEVEQLKEQLSAKQNAVDALKSQLQDALASHAEIATLRGELESARAAEQAAKEEASQQRAAADAAKAQGPANEELLSEIDRLQGLLRQAQDGESGARQEATQERENTAKAAADALKHRGAAKREKARADRNERLAGEALQLRDRAWRQEEYILELEALVERNAARDRRIRDVLDRRGISASSRRSERVVGLDPKIGEAFRTLELDTTATYEQMFASYKTLANLYHPDHQKDRPEKIRAMATSKFQQVVAARDVLEAYFKNHESAVA